MPSEEVGGCFFWGLWVFMWKTPKLGNQRTKDLSLQSILNMFNQSSPTKILINQFLFVKGVMISASSGSLGLGAVTLKEKKIRT